MSQVKIENHQQISNYLNVLFMLLRKSNINEKYLKIKNIYYLTYFVVKQQVQKINQIKFLLNLIIKLVSLSKGKVFFIIQFLSIYRIMKNWASVCYLFFLLFPFGFWLLHFAEVFSLFVRFFSLITNLILFLNREIS